jgi:hypothetical protein
VHNGRADDKSPAEDELAALRRRAYGPGADIGADPRAQARLADLERKHATRDSGAPAVAGTASSIGRATGVNSPPTVDTALGGFEASDAGDGAESRFEAAPAAAIPSVSDPGRMRRALPWVIAAGAVVVAIALGAMYVDAVTEPLVTEPPVTTPLPLLSEHADGVTLDPGRYVVDDFGAPSSATMAPVLQVPRWLLRHRRIGRHGVLVPGDVALQTTQEQVDELKQIVTTATFAEREGAWGAPVASRNTV